MHLANSVCVAGLARAFGGNALTPSSSKTATIAQTPSTPSVQTDATTPGAVDMRESYRALRGRVMYTICCTCFYTLIYLFGVECGAGD
jgi:hypothetical protein